MKADVIILGAGIMGLSTAWQLARRASLRIIVFERAGSLGAGSTGASSAVCRHRYTFDEIVELARDGISAYRDWSTFTGLPSPRATFHNDGVIWLNAEGSAWAKREQSRMQRLGIDAEVIGQDEISRRYPALSTCTTEPDLVNATEHDCIEDGEFLFETSGGYFEPSDALNDLAEALGFKKIPVIFNARISDIMTDDGKVTGIRTETGETHTAPVVINCTGPWCNELLEPLGLADQWSLKPTRIQMIHFNKPSGFPGSIPVCCDLVGGIYFREQNLGQQIVVGSAREEDEREVVDPDDYATWVDDDFVAARLHALKHRIPTLPPSIKTLGYTGLYTVNQEDVHPVVGPSPVDGLYLANGFSGHGFKLGPAIGSMIAQQITGTRIDFDTGIPLDFLAFDRQSLQVDAKNVMA